MSPVKIERLIPKTAPYQQTAKRAGFLEHAHGFANNEETTTGRFGYARVLPMSLAERSSLGKAPADILPDARVAYKHSKNGDLTPRITSGKAELSQEQQLAVTLTQMKQGNMSMSPDLEKAYKEAQGRLQVSTGLSSKNISRLQIAAEMLNGTEESTALIRKEVGKAVDLSAHGLAHASGEVKPENTTQNIETARLNAANAEYLAHLNAQNASELSSFMDYLSALPSDQVPAHFKTVYGALPKRDSGEVDHAKLASIMLGKGEEYDKLVSALFTSQEELHKVAVPPSKTAQAAANMATKVGNFFSNAWQGFRSWPMLGQVATWAGIAFTAFMGLFGISVGEDGHNRIPPQKR